jgi:hypothetical protein
VKSPEVVDFLRALLRPIARPLLIVWDRLAARRSGLVRDFPAEQDGWMLNSVEHIWCYWKQHELPTICSKDYWQLGQTAWRTLTRMRRRSRPTTAFWQQPELSAQ